ncbi:hypothetical protein FHS29_000319 [Saccharothrix tamanrassetensis]|uniref:ARB-07466-like C-terminal domain-containing protein n=1 Tax=Saccharothrix tamanrassetensis TaxID=1051531 RepID=A0A841C8L5_9PSEU|nr:hypothetical protein [Saccharothrix tamanrassetensis]MBB5953749.1 hypothetical protein [Saccharothrix tamanrassetensis]
MVNRHAFGFRAAAVATGLVLSTALCVAVPTASAAPPTPDFGAEIDGYAPHDPQNTCDPTDKPGVVEFKDLLAATYGNRHWGISRACDQGATSEHKEGRALDYAFNVTDATEQAQADDVLNWLMATDRHGNAHALVRRLGIMYIIWNNQIWSATDPRWTQYNNCSGDSGDPTACHRDHIHFSFSRQGANKETSWWTAQGAPQAEQGR